MIPLFICFTLISPFLTNAQESQPEEAPIYVDNKPIDTTYLIQDGHLLVPAVFFKNAGVKVDRSEKYHSIFIRNKTHALSLPIGKNYSDEFISKKNNWERFALSTKTVEAFDQIFVPFLDVAKKFEMDVRYDQKRLRTYVTTHSQDAPNIVNKGSDKKKLVALTFDDGPSESNTSKILDILEEKNAKATFFVMGDHVESHPQLLKRIVKEGHGIGNHTKTHPSLPDKMTADVIKEVSSTQDIIEKTTGRKPDIFRPPYGAITKSDAWLLHNMGLRIVTWSVDTKDWSGKTAEEIITTVENNISPGGIVLQHDFPSTDENTLEGSLEALPEMIDQLRREEYTFVTVQTMLDENNNL